MDEIAVLIPCYNEEYTINEVVTGFRKYLPDAAVYVYDNGSSDRTAELAEKAGAIVRYEPCRGKGNVVRRMFREVDAVCYIMIDGDATYDSEYASGMADIILKGDADMVVGNRMSGAFKAVNTRPFHTVGNMFVTNTVNILFGGDFKDVMTGYRAMSYAFVKSFYATSKGFEIETEMSVYAAERHMRVENIDIAYKERPPESPSKLSTFRDGIKILWMIIRMFSLQRHYWKNPRKLATQPLGR